jgi:hypothetical protein
LRDGALRLAREGTANIAEFRLGFTASIRLAGDAEPVIKTK